MVELSDEFAHLTLSADAQLGSTHVYIEAAGGEVSNEHEPPRIRRYIDKPADPAGKVRARIETVDVHATLWVDLQEREHRLVVAAALKQIELAGGVEDGERIGARSESESC